MEQKTYFFEAMPKTRPSEIKPQTLSIPEKVLFLLETCHHRLRRRNPTKLRAVSETRIVNAVLERHLQADHVDRLINKCKATNGSTKLPYRARLDRRVALKLRTVNHVLRKRYPTKKLMVSMSAIVACLLANHLDAHELEKILIGD